MNAFQRFLDHVVMSFYRLKIFGKENVPDGGAVIVCNHFRALDCGVVAKIYGKDIGFLAKNELFKNKLLAKLIKWLGGIPVDRENPAPSSMIKALKILKNGGKLAIFPEGTRNKTGTNELQPIKSGSGFFAVKAKVPIVPVMMERKLRFLRRNYVIVGKPFYLEEFYDKKLSEEDVSKIDNIVFEKMKEQLVELENKIKEKKRLKR